MFLAAADTCTGRELTPVDLPADGYVTITQVPKCLDMLGGEFNDDCFDLDVGPDYNGTLIHFYIPPAPTNRTLYASTCGMVNDGYWTQYTADTVIQVQYSEWSHLEQRAPLFHPHRL